MGCAVVLPRVTETVARVSDRRRKGLRGILFCRAPEVVFNKIFNNMNIISIIDLMIVMLL